MTSPLAISEGTRKALARRLIDAPRAAEGSHLILAAISAAVLRRVLSPAILIIWLGAVIIAALVRMGISDRLKRAAWDSGRVPTVLRLSILAVGVAWGLGVLYAAPLIPAAYLALIMVLFCGLVAGATSTLASDPPTYYAYLTTLLLPLSIAILITWPAHLEFEALAVVLTYVVGMVVVHRNAYRALVEYHGAMDQLEESHAEVQRERAFLDELLAAAPNAICVMHADLSIARVNQAFESLFGYTASEATHRDISDIVRPADGPDEKLRALAQSLTAGKVVHAEVARLRRHGETIHLSVAIGRIAGGDLLAIFDDITDRVRMVRRSAVRSAVAQILAEKTAEQEVIPAVLEAICANMEWDVGSMWYVDRRDDVLRLAGLWSRPGLDLGEFETRTRTMTFARGEGFAGRIWAAQLPLWFDHIADDPALPRITSAHKSGLESFVGMPMTDGGEVIGVLEFASVAHRSSNRDVLEILSSLGSLVGNAIARRRAEAELREAEAEYRQLVEGVSDLVWRVDREGRWTFLNRATETLYGQPPEALIGHSFGEVTDESRRDADQRAFQRILDGERLWDYETVHRDSTGRARHVSTSAGPIRDANGTIVGAHGIIRDVEERAAAALALREARDAAEQAAAARSAFLANMSHEIRTPMNGILGMAELLLDSDLSDEDRRSVDLIVTSGEALLAIINDVLDFSKIEAQQLELEEIEFDLPSLVESTTRLLTPKAQAQGIELITDVRQSAPQMVRGDPTRLRQVLTNLVGNAVKFTSKGEVAVTVAAAPAPEGKSAVRFAVVDTGVGIPADKIATIFEPFRQADASTTRRYGGTGLGLSISRRLVQLMGGTISLVSEVGKGSTFAFVLEFPVVTAAEPRSFSRDNLRGARTLVVDDNATNRRVARGILELGGCLVEETDSPSTVVERLRAAVREQHPFALLLTDLLMPDMDGFSLVERVRADAEVADTRIIILTSGGRRGDGQRCRDLGVGAYLLKPVARHELLDAASAVMGSEPGKKRRTLVTKHSIRESRRALRVLLAEDNLVNQEVAATMLRRRGHTVDIVGSGVDAVRAVQQKAYDTVLMDLQMPEMDGIEATARIREHLQGAPLSIVAVTANAMPGERERCLAAGMDDYLAKPFKPQDLFAVVEGVPAGNARAAENPTPPPHGSAVDVDGFRAELRSAGVEDSLDVLLALFVKEAPARMDALRKAFTTEDLDAVARAAHAFKSGAASIRARALAEVLRRIELSAKARDNSVRAMSSELEREYERAMSQLNALGVTADA